MSVRSIAGLSLPRLERLADLIEGRYVGPGKLPGAQLLVARGGDVAFSRAWGLMDRERGRSWGEDTLVRIYSMTKPVVSIALMMLWERGLFLLDDPVESVLPEWRGQSLWIRGEGEAMETRPLERPVTFRQILSHTAGLTYGAALASVGFAGAVHPVDQAYAALGVRQDPLEDLDAFVAKLGKAPLRYTPGQKWMYSFATDVAGALVQRLTGRPLDQVLQAEIFGPLGMVDTGFHVRPGQAGRFAACYRWDGAQGAVLQDDPQASPFLQAPAFLSGGGGLVSTIADYHRFCEMLRQGGELDGVRLVGPRTLKLMTANHLPNGATLTELALDGFSETSPAGVGFGLGFAATLDGTRAGSPCEGDFYWGGAASTFFWVDPHADLVAIFLTQLMPSTTFPLRGQLKSVVYAALA